MPNAGRAFVKATEAAGQNIEDVNQRFQDRMKDRVEAFQAQMAGVSDTLRAVSFAPDPVPDLGPSVILQALQDLRAEVSELSANGPKAEPKRKGGRPPKYDLAKILSDLRDGMPEDEVKKKHGFPHSKAWRDWKHRNLP